jgi:hypothetical protein
VIPEIVRRAVELGVEKAQGAPDNVKHFVGEMKLPKEIAQVVFSQIDETKNGLFRVVAKELRDFLEQTNFSGEIQKLLTTVQFEVNTTIRFTPNDGKSEKKKPKKEKKAPAPEIEARERERDDDEDPLDDAPRSERDRDGEEEGYEDEEAGEEEEAPLLPRDEDDERRTLPTPEVKTTVQRRRRERG